MDSVAGQKRGFLMKGLRSAALGVALMACVSGVATAHAQKKGKAGKAADAQAAEVEEDPAKFFLFHRPGVATDVARADLTYCIEQVKGIISDRDRYGGGGGLIGALIGARMAEIDRFRMRNAGMRKCMALHGYARYQVPQVEWKKLVKEGDIVLGNDGVVDFEVVDRMATFASGETPAGARLDP